MKSTALKRSYAGETVYVGIDVHKRTYAVVARVGQEEVKRWSTLAEPANLAIQLGKYFPEARIEAAYEAGFSGFVLHRTLEQQGINCIVVHAAAVEISAHNRVKTDKRDAAKLAQQLEAGRLKAIRIPIPSQESRRLLTRTRAQLMKQRIANQNRIRMKAHQFGLIGAEEKRVMSHSFVAELVESSDCHEFQIAITVIWEVWKVIDEQISVLTAELAQQANQDMNEATYRSAPGVGALSARILSNELGNLLQFANERQLFSYTGLTPSEYSSGDTVRKGAITKQGNRHLRGVLIEVAWRAIAKDPALAEVFNRLWPRTGKTRAIVAVARKLMGRIRAAFRKGELYELGYSMTAP